MYIRIVMRTTLTIDTQLYEEASKLTGISEKAKLVREALNALIARESGKRLAKLGGSTPDLKNIPRRRSKP
jgi:Arc/MetJ family transcription regulator